MNLTSIYSLTPVARPWPTIRNAYKDLLEAHAKLMRLLAMWNDPACQLPYGLFNQNLYCVYDQLAFASFQLAPPMKRKRGARTFATQADLRLVSAIDAHLRPLLARMLELHQGRALPSPDMAMALFDIERDLALLIEKVVKPGQFESQTRKARELLVDGAPMPDVMARLDITSEPLSYLGSVRAEAGAA